MSAQYLIYDRSTGRVVAHGSCEPGYECDQVIDPSSQDYLCIDGLVPDPETMRVVDGRLALIDEMEI
ncbi:MAG: hypothetical protein HZA68_04870 [Rhodovulum sp.]|nr:hypothetical protein [Rhodovulum sp.]